MSLFEDIDQREKAYALAKTIDDIRLRYGTIRSLQVIAINKMSHIENEHSIQVK